MCVAVASTLDLTEVTSGPGPVVLETLETLERTLKLACVAGPDGWPLLTPTLMGTRTQVQTILKSLSEIAGELVAVPGGAVVLVASSGQESNPPVSTYCYQVVHEWCAVMGIFIGGAPHVHIL